MKRAAALVLSALVVSGCGTGFQAHTYEQTGRSDGVSKELESLVIRNLHIQPPGSGGTIDPGSDAVLTGALVNRGEQPDLLVSVTSPIATTVTLTQAGTVAAAVSIPAGGSAGEWTATLSGLTSEVRTSTYVEVTMTFSSGGRTTVSVPVRLGEADLEDREVLQEPYEH